MSATNADRARALVREWDKQGLRHVGANDDDMAMMREQIAAALDAAESRGAAAERERLAAFVEQSQAGDGRRQARDETARRIAAAIRAGTP